jgi:hypothetical protein
VNARHVELTWEYTRWTGEALEQAIPGEACRYSATVTMHPAAPPPGVVVLVWVLVPSLARLGSYVAGAHMVPIEAVTEETVKDATRTAVGHALQGRTEQLKALNGGPGGMAFPPLDWKPE